MEKRQKFLNQSVTQATLKGNFDFTTGGETNGYDLHCTHCEVVLLLSCRQLVGAGPGNSCCRFKGTKPFHCRDQRERVEEGIDSGGYLLSLKMIFSVARRNYM